MCDALLLHAQPGTAADTSHAAYSAFDSYTAADFGSGTAASRTPFQLRTLGGEPEVSAPKFQEFKIFENFDDDDVTDDDGAFEGYAAFDEGLAEDGASPAEGSPMAEVDAAAALGTLLEEPGATMSPKGEVAEATSGNSPNSVESTPLIGSPLIGTPLT